MKKFFKEAKGHLMTGIGYMLPLIIGASLVVAIPKLIGVAMGINSLDIYAEKEGFLHILYSVSYTHLDVYKRQMLKRINYIGIYIL